MSSRTTRPIGVRATSTKNQSAHLLSWNPLRRTSRSRSNSLDCAATRLHAYANVCRPAYLQPQHQPQIRLPPISTALHPHQSAMPQAMKPVLFHSPLAQYTPDQSALMQHQSTHDVANEGCFGYTSYGIQDGYGDQDHLYQPYTRETHSSWDPFNSNGTVSPATPLPTEASTTLSFVTPSIGPTSSFPYGGAEYAAEYSSPSFGFYEHGRRISHPHYEGLPEGSNHRGWPNAEFCQSHEGLHTLSGHHQAHSPSMPHRGPLPRMISSPQNLPSGSPLTWEGPLTVQVNQISHDDMAPPPALGGSDPHRRSWDLVASLPSSNHQEGNKLAATKPRKSRAAMGVGQFIHALCGKDFHSRSAVKKHHWGHAKAGDTSTTTGCWAKKNKPDREWYAHLCYLSGKSCSIQSDMTPGTNIQAANTTCQRHALRSPRRQN
jgi:hypothetical protein